MMIFLGDEFGWCTSDARGSIHCDCAADVAEPNRGTLPIGALEGERRERWGEGVGCEERVMALEEDWNCK